MLNMLKNIIFDDGEEKKSDNTLNALNTSDNKNNIFGSIEEKDFEDVLINNLNKVYFEVIQVNPNVYLAHRGARICIGKGPLEDSFREKSRYVSKVLARQHESIMEHTNIIVLIHLPKLIVNNYIGDYTDFFSSLKYCNVISTNTKDEIILLIGGSIRAFIHALRETRKNNYFILNVWKSIIYSSIEKDFLRNCFKDELLDENECNYITNSEKFDDTEEDYTISKVEPIKEEEISNTVTLVYKNNLLEIYEKVKLYFSLKDVAKVCTLSFIFHDISRSCSHQLVRHRNGISQESQRYVTKKYVYEEDFVNPIYLEKERYKNVNIDDYLDFTDTFRNYNELIEMGIHKEDARAWLPTNVKTKLMMTFTYDHFCKFLKLRLDSHAQTEIRLLAQCAASSILKDIEKISEYVGITDGMFNENQPNNSMLLMNFIDYICKYNSLVLKNSDNIIESENIDDEEISSLDIDNDKKAEEILNKSEKFSKLSDD